MVSAFVLLVVACETGDDESIISSRDLSGTVESPTILEDIIEGPGADYYITSKWTLNAAVTINPGVNIMMKSGASIYVNEEGSINAEGTALLPIAIFGEQSTKGYWADIDFDNSNQPANIMKYVFISDGGNGYGDGLLTVSGNSQLSMSNCMISNSKKYGLFVVNEEVRIPVFEYNNISQCSDYPIGLYTSQLHFIDSTTHFLNNGDNSVIEVTGNTLSENVIWKNLRVPVLFTGPYNNIQGDVTVEAGAVFLMGPEALIRVESEGSFHLNGAIDEPIIIQGKVDSPGYFASITFDDSNNPLNEMNYVHLANGGGGYYNSNIAITGSTHLKISNCNISSSSGHGLFVSRYSTLSDMGNNTFLEITGDDIFVQQ